VRNRATGAFDAIKKYLPDIPMEFFVRADSRGLGRIANSERVLRTWPDRPQALAISE
jgi:hypothetical protein